MFIGRENELKEIRELLGNHDYQGIFIYGRRRVGKTELIAQALSDTPYRQLSFEFRKTTLIGNLNLFVPYVKRFFNDEYVAFDSFDSLFDYLLSKSVDEEYVLVMDEFSFLLNEDFSVESSLAAAIDKYKSKSKIHLLISGSHVGLMEKMISKNAHSYGRFNHIIPLRPFDYYTSSLFYPNYSAEDKIMLYSVFGGVPYFNSLIDTSKSALENILDLFVKEDSICEREVNDIIIAETSKMPLMNELLLALVRGKHKYKDIESVFLSQGYGRPDYLLDKLIDMDFIDKRYPINDEGNKKRTRYCIKDHLIDFYYRYLFIAQTRALRRNPEFYFNHFIKEDFFHDYIPHKFEDISKEFLIRMNLLEKINPPFIKLGEYYFDNPKMKINRQFDIVTMDQKGYIAYECKYRNSPIDQGDINEEISQTMNLPDICFYRLGFISKSGYTDTVERQLYNTFTLDDFYLSE